MHKTSQLMHGGEYTQEIVHQCKMHMGVKSVYEIKFAFEKEA